jgi:DNA-binding MarR family transcriptional regulator
MMRGLVDDLVRRFARAAGKYRALEETPIKLASGISVFGSEMHMAAAIGEGAAQTAMDLASLFGVSKGAVSQAVTKMESKGWVKREYAPGNDKTKLLSLTSSGRTPVRLHERLHGANRPMFEARDRGIPQGRRDAHRRVGRKNQE